MAETSTELGFVVTPDEIGNRIRALDASIQKLAEDVAKSSAPRLDKLWRFELNAFLRRWAIERDSYATWSAKLFATRVMPRLDAYEASYRRWARAFEARTGKAPRVPDARPQEGLAASLVPSEVWWILGAAAGLWVLTKR